jgi:hypothetical protein
MEGNRALSLSEEEKEIMRQAEDLSSLFSLLWTDRSASTRGMSVGG